MTVTFNSLISQRTYLRQQLTKASEAFHVALASNDANLIRNKFHILDDKARRLFEVDTAIEANRDLSAFTEAQLTKEWDKVEKYRDLFTVDEVSFHMHQELQLEPSNPFPQSGNLSHRQDPTIPSTSTLKKFDGDLGQWLTFWNSFKKIDEHPTMPAEEKIEYLLQTMVPDTEAFEIVSSYPPTADNYPKALQDLKNRFGKDEYLIEHYSRELYVIISNQLLSSKQKYSLSQLHAKLNGVLSYLENLGVLQDRGSITLFPPIESTLPDEVLLLWQREKLTLYKQDNVNMLAELMNFLKREVESSSRVVLSQTDVFNRSQVSIASGQGQATAASLLSTADSSVKGKTEILLICVFCGKTHESPNCYKLKDKTVAERRALAAEVNVCTLCLRKGHAVGPCKSKNRCLFCGRKHHIILCETLEDSKAALPAVANRASSTPTTNRHQRRRAGDTTSTTTPHNDSVDDGTTSACNTSCSPVFLQTLLVRVQSDQGTRIVRAMLDSASHFSYISGSLAQQLKCSSIETIVLKHNVFGGSYSEKPHDKYVVQVGDLANSHNFRVPLLREEVICRSIPKSVDLTQHPEFQGLINDEQRTIEILIGADLLAIITTGKTLRSDNQQLLAVETIFGWAVMGQCSPDRALCPEDALNFIEVAETIALPTLVNFWELDLLGIRDPIDLKSKEARTLEFISEFTKNLSKNTDDRYEVSLPWKDVAPLLQSNRNVAEIRLKNISQRLLSQNRFSDYNQVFMDWQRDGIIEEISDTPENRSHGHYLPHRPVFKSGSSTPVRPVFDASCKDSQCLSLNQCLETGPNLIDLIPKFLIRFRCFAFGITADIQRAFLQISLTESDREKLKFLWWDADREKLKVFQHKRLVFGLTCSPFILNLVIRHHLDQNLKLFPFSVEKLRDSFYIDNLLSGVDSQAEIQPFIEEAVHVMSLAKFNLCQWAQTATSTDQSRNSNPVNVLGLVWDPVGDTLACVIKSFEFNVPITKRIILSATNQIFDPLGIISPVMLIPKLILKDCWALKFKWDEPLPEEFASRFQDWAKDFARLADFRVSRYFGIKVTPENATLHVFCDASGVAYSFCVYLRIEDAVSVSSFLLFSKARVAPTLLELNIPRLELLGASIAARAGVFVQEAFHQVKLPTYYWTDSQVVLSWLNNLHNDQVFVRNRIKEILGCSNATDWHYVPSTFNPADFPSRGCTVSQFIQLPWTHNIPWLEGSLTDKLNASDTFHFSILSVVTAANFSDESGFFAYFSSYFKTIRMVARMLRWRQPPADRSVGPITAEEFEKAETRILRIIQHDKLSSDLRPNLQVVNRNGLVCVKTKLTAGPFSHDFAYPILLPPDHVMVERLIRDVHIQNHHVGAETLISLLRERYWIARSRRLVIKILKTCVPCQRLNVRQVKVPEAPLPVARVTTGKAFQVSGVDLAGPLYLLDGSKAWTVIFTCAVYRAIHLELLFSLSAEAFIRSLRRFISRRGRLDLMYSDNGTNFVGTDNQLKRVQEWLTTQRINWKFNPPSAPWWGGWWERLVRIVKDLLKRNLGTTKLSSEELQTLLCDCEAMINCRPLTYQSVDPNDFTAIRPIHFLQDLPSNSVPDLDLIDESHISYRARVLQALRDSLRERFQREYLSQLIHVGKNSPIRELEVGEVVLIGSDNLKRILWPMGIIIKIYPGIDGIPRTADVKTSQGTLTRPFQRLYPLELKVSDQSDLYPTAVEVKANQGTLTRPFQQPDPFELKVSKQSNSLTTASPVPSVKVTRSGRSVKVPDRLDL